MIDKVPLWLSVAETGVPTVVMRHATVKLDCLYPNGAACFDIRDDETGSAATMIVHVEQLAHMVALRKKELTQP